MSTMCELKFYKGYFRRWSPVSEGNNHFLKNLNTLLSKIKFKILTFCHLRPQTSHPVFSFQPYFKPLPTAFPNLPTQIEPRPGLHTQHSIWHMDGAQGMNEPLT